MRVQGTKEAMVEGGVIASAFCRHPIAPLHPQTKAGLLELMAPLDPLVLRWGSSCYGPQPFIKQIAG